MAKGTPTNLKSKFKQPANTTSLVTKESSTTVSLLLTEDEKYDGEQLKVKKIVYYYEQLGWNQMKSKEEKFKKLYNLAYGVINPEDYVEVAQKDEFSSVTNNEELDGLKLQFYPIIPNIVNSIVGEADKKIQFYTVQAVNKEAVNEILDMRNKELRSILVKNAQALFDAENPGLPEDKKKEMFEQLPSVQKYYNTEYKHEVEKWANHVINVDKERFDMPKISRKVLESIVVTEHPYVHINLTEQGYHPEVLESHNTFYLKSPYAEDVSDSMMFGWFTYENLTQIISKYDLNEKETEKLHSWHGRKINALVDNPGNHGYIDGNNNRYNESINNWMEMKQLQYNTNGSRYDEFYNGQSLVRVTHVYFLLPRKVGTLTYRQGNEVFTELVDENFKQTSKPSYSTKKKQFQNETTLISGEHIEWSYVNEVWKAVKIERNSAPYAQLELIDNNREENTIWVELRKLPLQPSRKNSMFGAIIPVHGGPTSNMYNRSFSLVEKCANWQILYNFLWNKNSQLLATEIGKFFAFDQHELPNESMGESWQKNPLMAFKVANDTSLLPMDRSVGNLGQQTSGGSFGQLVDLTKTSDILEKANLAAMIKQECYSLVGITPQQLGEISPYQSATSIKQGIQRSSTQLQYIYSRHADLMKQVWETMLQFAQYTVSTQGDETISYTASDASRVMFKTDGLDFDIHRLGIFVNNDINEVEVLENIKMLAMNDNTMGASAFEKAAILQAKTSLDVIERLKEIEIKKENQVKQQQEFEAQQQQKEIEAEQQAIQARLTFDAEQNQLDRENRIMESQIKAMGYANDNAENIQANILDLQTANAKQQEMYQKMSLAERLQTIKEQKMKDDSENAKKQLSQNEALKLKELQLREMDIKARNARTNAIKSNK